MGNVTNELQTRRMLVNTIRTLNQFQNFLGHKNWRLEYYLKNCPLASRNAKSSDIVIEKFVHAYHEFIRLCKILNLNPSKELRKNNIELY
ncbi:hypothetical protein CPJCM30710_27610 [Clostridium polyendosporum]|uniref:Uncharacterized protein n=1 Tax=Clostridium polyendosporum TaxID=69208 RepID=A0A919S0P8_9CLOT|nr:hypothetical protein [Clostridium polyendosporum]GIM30095.1 hypothetical protein CPJCM30710_27610 [Clostridium polyendosporum]